VEDQAPMTVPIIAGAKNKKDRGAGPGPERDGMARKKKSR